MGPASAAASDALAAGREYAAAGTALTKAAAQAINAALELGDMRGSESPLDVVVRPRAVAVLQARHSRALEQARACVAEVQRCGEKIDSAVRRLDHAVVGADAAAVPPHLVQAHALAHSLASCAGEETRVRTAVVAALGFETRRRTLTVYLGALATPAYWNPGQVDELAALLRT